MWFFVSYLSLHPVLRSSFPKPTPLGRGQISQLCPKWIMKNATGWEGDVLILVNQKSDVCSGFSNLQ